MAHGRCGRALGRLLGASGGVFGGLGEVFGVMLAPKMAAKSGKYRKKYGSKRQAVPEWFFDGFCVEDKQPERPQRFYLSLGILVSNAYRRLQHRHRICSCLVATWPHVGFQNPGKLQSRRHPGEVLWRF